ncbi:FAD/NAD(P)-binding protein [Rhodococcus qingshengii]|uniref:FAD/NAD(P)-binding protein n=1 Tax=Rhodococcus qingshengii TaxID=334542 RepID=UPI0021B1299D|nr:FAD/NAD(P)-binding protein [Rhodococcus qingshengii]MCT6736588.1 FAD/NAD(P)-binding protein [Rhodococcus qingshengii]
MPHRHIAIVGAGPRGTITLERLTANIEAAGNTEPVTIHLIDPFDAGPGRIWHSRQSRSLLMNTVASDITVFTDDTVTCEGPLTPGPNHYQWAKLVATEEILAQSEESLAEARAMRPWTYPSRVLQGEYLQWALEHIKNRAPRHVTVVHHLASAISAEEASTGGYRLDLDNHVSLHSDSIVLAVGHFETDPTTRSVELTQSTARSNLLYVAPANASEIDLGQVQASENVILNGLGLNFFDYVALLTTGRGGYYETGTDGELIYRSSGDEPHLHACSRRGVPYWARAEFEVESTTRYQPRYFTLDRVRQFQARSATESLDFLRDVWPLVQKETAWVYYRTMFAALGRSAALDTLRSCFDAHEWESPEISLCIADLVPESERLDWATIDQPTRGRHFTSPAEYSAWVGNRLTDDYIASSLGPEVVPIKAVAAIMRDLRDEIRQVISHGGISGHSYSLHIDGWFSGLNNLIASGPPRSRIAELIALHKANVISFIGPNTTATFDDHSGRFIATSPAVTDSRISARVLIDAFLPKNDVRTATDPLIRSMYQSGKCRSFEMTNPDGTTHQSGGLDVESTAFRVVNADGKPHSGIYSFGPPIESVQWVTAIGARPGVNSRTLLQADLIARSILRNPVQQIPATSSAIASTR